MINQTKPVSEVRVNDKEIWYFESGLPGFADEREFVLNTLQNNDGFYLLQSKQSEEVAFVVTNPFHFFQDYDFTLDENCLTTLQLNNPADVIVLVILTLRDSLESSTVNLQAPVILNKANNKGKQVILHDTPYKTRHSLISK